MPTPKTLHIPYLPQLDRAESADETVSILESQGARRIISCANWRKEYPYTPLASFAVAHSGTALYIDFFTRSNYLRAEAYEDLGPVSKDSCVEFFVQPHPDGEYWNFEYNCIGILNASHRKERTSPTRLIPAELSRVTRMASCGNRPFREVEGLFTWNLLTSIPLDLIGVAYDGFPLEMRGNFYKCASGTSQPHFLSWSPIATAKPDFHRPEYFGKLILQ